MWVVAISFSSSLVSNSLSIGQFSYLSVSFVGIVLQFNH